MYTHPGHRRAERCDYWVELMERFGSGIDHSGYEDALRYRWQAQLHIFEVPFYYIEYGIAQLGAMQIWSNSRKDLRRAVQAYKSALRLGGSRPLPELFTAANIRFDFSKDTIQPLMAEVREELDRQAKLERS
jgi:oligoendopeptidase F